MSATVSRLSGDAADADDAPTCEAPSCWDDADEVEIADSGVEDAPVLCETHRRAFLGVSS